MKLHGLLTKENIEWLLKTLRPKAYVRIAFWALVAGIALLATPIWYPILQAAALASLGISLSDTSNALAGTIIVLGAMAFFAFCFGLEQLQHRVAIQQDRTHDLAVATKILEWMPDKRMEWITDTIWNQDAIWSHQSRMLDDLQFDLKSPSCRLINASADQRRVELVNALAEINDFISRHFFIYGQQLEDRSYLALHPELNIDRDGHDPTDTRYGKFSDELASLVKNLKGAYEALLSAFHHELAYTALATNAAVKE